MSVGKKYVTKDDSEAFARKLVRRVRGARLGGGSTQGGGGASAFTELSDVPSSYSGEGLKGVRVNAAEDALEFFDLEIGALVDVDLGSGAADGDVLVYDGSSGLWVPGPGGGAVPALCDLTDVDCDSPYVPQDGDALVFDGSSGLWVPTPPAPPGSHNLCDLLDVECGSPFTPQDGDILIYDGSSGLWTPGPAPAGGTLALEDLTDVDAASPNDNDIIRFDAGSGLWKHEALPAGGAGSDFLVCQVFS